MYAHPEKGSTGDADAFAVVYERYRARLVAYCRRRLYNPADAEDAAHEAMVRAYRAFPGFDARTDAWPWLATIATRVCTDVRRRERRTQAEPPSPPAYDVHDEAMGRLRAELLGEALDRLPPRYRTTLVLHEFGGWTYDEIAQLQGRTMSSVRSVVARGRRRLGASVESLARGRGQWPLPGAVPGLARRVRSYLRSLPDRSVPAALLGLDPMVLFGRLGAAQAAAVVMLSAAAFGSLLLGSPASSSPAGPAAGVVLTAPDVQAGPLAGSAPRVREALEAVHEAAEYHAARVGAEVPTDGTPVSAATHAVVIDPSTSIRVRHEYRVEVPTVGERRGALDVNIPCEWRSRTNPLCPPVQAVFEATDGAP